jgi:hypothetical protein
VDSDDQYYGMRKGSGSKRATVAVVAAVCWIFAGCATLKPSPEAKANAEARPWGSQADLPHDDYPVANLIANLLQGLAGGR